MAFILAACDGGDPMDVEESNHAVTHLAMATDAGDDASSVAVEVGDDRVPEGTYTFDEIKALLIAADPAFAAALASTTTTDTPPDGAVPAAVERSSDGPCMLPREPTARDVAPAPYVAPNWEREVDVFERLAAIPAHDLVTLDEVHAGLAAAAAHDDGTESPTPH